MLDNSYAIEATVHAPSLEGVYGQIFKVLKPGGVFGVYEWLMTDDYDATNPRHREICHGIEVGDGISQMVKISEALRAIKACGFELEFHEDLAQRPDEIPWWYPLGMLPLHVSGTVEHLTNMLYTAGEMKHVRSVSDFLTVLRMTKVGRGVMHKFIGGLETVGVAPAGTQKTADALALAADSLVAGAKENLFTPMYLMIARKPLNA